MNALQRFGLTATGSEPANGPAMTPGRLAELRSVLERSRHCEQIGEKVAICERCGSSVWSRNGGVEIAVMLSAEVWQATGAERFCCLACVEYRIGRRLAPEDFRTDPVLWALFPKWLQRRAGVSKRSLPDGSTVFAGRVHYVRDTDHGWWLSDDCDECPAPSSDQDGA